jgi:hypothetical protein
MWLKLIIGEVNFGWLAVRVPSPDWLRRRSDCCQALRWSRHAWGGGGVWGGPRLNIVYPWHLPYNWGKSRKTSVRVAEKCPAVQRRTRSVWSTWPSRAMASTGLLTPTTRDLRQKRRGQPSVSVGICRVAVQGGSPRQLTLSKSSPSGLWRGRQKAEHPGPRVFACYLHTRGHQ